MVELHVGDTNVVVEVVMRDANGNETDNYQAGSIVWTSTDEAKVAVADDDANPKDARVDVLALTDPDTPVRLGLTFDGDPGDGVREVSGETEDIFVVPGPATSAEVRIRLLAV